MRDFLSSELYLPGLAIIPLRAIQPNLGHAQPKRLGPVIRRFLRPAQAIGGTPAQFVRAHDAQ
jgi:hypothetical protein